MHRGPESRIFICCVNMSVLKTSLFLEGVRIDYSAHNFHFVKILLPRLTFPHQCHSVCDLQTACLLQLPVLVFVISSSFTSAIFVSFLLTYHRSISTEKSPQVSSHLSHTYHSSRTRTTYKIRVELLSSKHPPISTRIPDLYSYSCLFICLPAC